MNSPDIRRGVEAALRAATKSRAKPDVYDCVWLMELNGSLAVVGCQGQLMTVTAFDYHVAEGRVWALDASVVEKLVRKLMRSKYSGLEFSLEDDGVLFRCGESEPEFVPSVDIRPLVGERDRVKLLTGSWIGEGHEHVALELNFDVGRMARAISAIGYKGIALGLHGDEWVANAAPPGKNCVVAGASFRVDVEADGAGIDECIYLDTRLLALSADNIPFKADIIGKNPRGRIIHYFTQARPAIVTPPLMELPDNLIGGLDGVPCSLLLSWQETGGFRAGVPT